MMVGYKPKHKPVLVKSLSDATRTVYTYPGGWIIAGNTKHKKWFVYDEGDTTLSCPLETFQRLSQACYELDLVADSAHEGYVNQ